MDTFLITLRVVGLILLWIGVAVWNEKQRRLLNEIVDQVNTQLPDQKKYSYDIWWYSSKHRRLNTDYRGFFPTGDLLKRHIALNRTGIPIAIIASLLLFGLPFGLIAALYLGVGALIIHWFTFQSFR